MSGEAAARVAEQTDDPVAAEMAEFIETAAMSVDNPEKLAELVAGYFKDHFGGLVQTAYWITLTKERERDKGIAVQIAKLPLGLRLKGLIGGWSAGFGVYSQPYDLGGTFHHVKVAIGAGAVMDYNHLDKLIPVAGFTVSF